MTFDEAGELIECVKKNGEEDIEAPETASTTDGPGRGTETGKPSDMNRGLKIVCRQAGDTGRDRKANRM